MTTCSRCWWFYVPGEPGPIVALIAHWDAAHGGVPAVRYLAVAAR
jgi:hypothetical protein